MPDQEVSHVVIFMIGGHEAYSPASTLDEASRIVADIIEIGASSAAILNRKEEFNWTKRMGSLQ